MRDPHRPRVEVEPVEPRLRALDRRDLLGRAPHARTLLRGRPLLPRLGGLRLGTGLGAVADFTPRGSPGLGAPTVDGDPETLRLSSAMRNLCPVRDASTRDRRGDHRRVAAGDRERLGGGDAREERAVVEPELAPCTAQRRARRRSPARASQERLLSPLPRGGDLVEHLRRRAGREIFGDVGAGHQVHCRTGGHAAILDRPAASAPLMGCGPQALVRGLRGGGRRSPLVERIVLRQREPVTRGVRGVEADAGDLHEHVAGARLDRHPLAGPGLPQLISGPEASGPLSRPAAASANETEPEQS